MSNATDIRSSTSSQTSLKFTMTGATTQSSVPRCTPLNNISTLPKLTPPMSLFRRVAKSHLHSPTWRDRLRSGGLMFWRPVAYEHHGNSLRLLLIRHYSTGPCQEIPRPAMMICLSSGINGFEHLGHHRLVLSRLCENNLYVGDDKFEKMRTETEFLGLMIGKDGVSTTHERKQAVAEWPRLNTPSEHCSIIGLLQFFCRFVKDFSSKAAPLTDLIRKHGGIQKWNSLWDMAIRSFKDTLVSVSIMKPLDWTSPFRCHVDACEVAVEGKLFQLGGDGSEQAIAYFL